MNSNILMIENFLSKEEVDKILNKISSFEDWNIDGGHPFWHNRLINAKNIYENYDAEVGLILYNAKEKIKKHIENYYKLDKEIYADTLQAVRWFPGMSQPPHADDMTNVPEADEMLKQRKFGSIIYLNDNYSGGNTFYPNLDINVRPKSGTLVVHPGDTDHTHGVTTVEDNIRYTIASFWVFDKERDAWTIH